MDEAGLKAEVVEAALAWAQARREWEASSRETARPANYGELKGNIRRAERQLMGKIQALELHSSANTEQE